MNNEVSLKVERVDVTIEVTKEACETAGMSLTEAWGALVASGNDPAMMKRTADRIIVYTSKEQ